MFSTATRGIKHCTRNQRADRARSMEHSTLLRNDAPFHLWDTRPAKTEHSEVCMWRFEVRQQNAKYIVL